MRSTKFLRHLQKGSGRMSSNTASEEQTLNRLTTVLTCDQRRMASTKSASVAAPSRAPMANQSLRA